jgi:hypothetical protein
MATVSSLHAGTRLTVTNETFKTVTLYFDSQIYKRPQIERFLPKQTRSVYLEDYSDKDITKDITLEARGGTWGSVTWSFAQTDLKDNMALVFSQTEQRPLKLTVIKPNGQTRVIDPISRQ